MVALTATTIYRRMRGGTFPLPIQVGGSGSAVRWLQSEILEWIASRPRATGNGDDAAA